MTTYRNLMLDIQTLMDQFNNEFLLLQAEATDKAKELNDFRDTVISHAVDNQTLAGLQRQTDVIKSSVNSSGFITDGGDVKFSRPHTAVNSNHMLPAILADWHNYA